MNASARFKHEVTRSLCQSCRSSLAQGGGRGHPGILRCATSGSQAGAGLSQTGTGSPVLTSLEKQTISTPNPNENALGLLPQGQ